MDRSPTQPAKSLLTPHSRAAIGGGTKRYEHWNPQHLGYKFLAEAKRLWELEVGKARLTTIHAGLVITLNHNMNCMDRVGWIYTLQAISIAYDLQLFNSAAEVRGTKERRARDFTACALFNYQGYVHDSGFSLPSPVRQQSLHCYVMFDEPGLVRADLDQVPAQLPAGLGAVRSPLQSVRRHSGHHERHSSQVFRKSQ